MKSIQIVEALQNIKGQHVKVVWARKCKVKKGSPDIVKRTIAHVRTGIDYANIAEVREAIAAKERGDVQPIWNGKGEWVNFPFVFKHVDSGSEYVRFYPASFDNLHPSVQYFENGTPVSFEAVKSYLYASEIPDGTTPLCYCLKAEDVETIGI